MRRVARYWTLWRTLPDEERRVRLARLTERLLRRRPGVRRLGLAPDPPPLGRLRRALSIGPRELAARLRGVDPRRGPLFADLAPRAAAVAETFPTHAHATLEAAERILEGRFDLLGSGERSLLRPEGGLHWALDWRSGLDWPRDRFHTEVVTVRGDGSDVKLPWELSRCQHLTVLGQAWHLAPHLLPAGEAERCRRRVAGCARAHVEDWLRANPRGLGVNWTCTMEVAIRATNWIAALGLLRDAEEFDDAFVVDLVRALWSHGRYIRGHLEIGNDDLTSNHYLSDIIGLYAIACALPELREAAGWSRLARAALVEEIGRQVHPDGVDFERSLPYHRLVSEIFVHGAILARGCGDELPEPYLERLARMLEFTATATRDDHSVPQWGDNDDGRLLPLEGYATRHPQDHRHLLVLGGRLLGRDDLLRAGAGVEALWLLGPPLARVGAEPAERASRAFEAGGYYVLRHADLHCGVSCGPVGTRGVGNHTHNDLLSVVLWADGSEWITDPGSGSYTGDPGLRDRLRATAAHATLQLGRREQNGIPGGLEGLFRLDERAGAELLRWEPAADGALFEGLHHGFDGSDCRWEHRRRIALDGRARTWRVLDTLSASRAAASTDEPARLRFPLHPDVDCRLVERPPDAVRLRLERAREEWGAPGPRTNAVAWLFRAGSGGLWLALDLPVDAQVATRGYEYSPRYGVTCAATLIEATWTASERSRALWIAWSPRGEAESLQGGA